MIVDWGWPSSKVEDGGWRV